MQSFYLSGYLFSFIKSYFFTFVDVNHKEGEAFHPVPLTQGAVEYADLSSHPLN